MLSGGERSQVNGASINEAGTLSEQEQYSPYSDVRQGKSDYKSLFCYKTGYRRVNHTPLGLLPTSGTFADGFPSGRACLLANAERAVNPLQRPFNQRNTSDTHYTLVRRAKFSRNQFRIRENFIFS